MKCWNCLHANSKKAHHCEMCGQALQPNAAQQIAGSRNLDYLLNEMDNWDFVDSDARLKLESVYRKRQQRLSEVSEKKQTEWPTTDWGTAQPAPPSTQPVSAEVEDKEAGTEESTELDKLDSLDAEAEAEPEVEFGPKLAPQTPQLGLTPAPLESPELQLTPTTPKEPGYLDTLVGEADIRWFHTLGALLVVAAVVGWLRASWDSYGKLMTGVLIAISPFAMHLVSHKLKKSVPLSSRLLAILANVLTPPALLALDVFGMLPSEVSSEHYWTFSLLVSAALLGFQAQATKEKIPLYLGALCCVMAGWSQGGLTTASLSLAVGFVFARDWGEQDESWLQERQRVSFYAGTFGALATLSLFDTSRHPTIPIFAFTAGLLFTSLPTLTGHEESNSKSRIFLQAALGIIGSILMRTALDLPPGGVALYLLFCSALFLAVKSDSELAQISVKLASVLGFLGLGIGFFGNLAEVFSAQQSPKDALLRLVFSLLGGVYFLGASRKRKLESEAQPLILASALSLLGGWIHFALFASPLKDMADLLPLVGSLVIFEALLLAGTRKLQPRETRVVWSLCLPLLVLTGVLAFLGQILTPPEAIGWSVTLAAHALLAFLWERGWLAGQPETETKEYRIIFITLPRIVLGATALSFCQSAYVPHAQLKLAIGLAITILGTFVLKNRYQNASWEAAWLLCLSSLAVVHQPSHLVAASASSCLLAYSVAKRKASSLALSCGFGTVILTIVAQQLPLLILFIPAAAFAIATVAPARCETEWQEVGKSRWGFPLLLAVVIVLAKPFDSGSVGNLAYCLVLGLFAGLCSAIWQKKNPPKLLRLIDVSTGPSLLIVLFCWSLSQTTYETALLALLGSSAIALFSKDKNKTQVASGIALLGLAQGFSNTHFLFDSLVLCAGIVIFEICGLVRKKTTPQMAHLIVLVVAIFQEHSTLWPHLLESGLTIATLILAISAVRTDQHSVAVVSTCLFLGKIDGLVQDTGVDFRLRLIPTAITLIAASLWKFRSKQTWPKPALQVGLSLLVAPALLSFAAGFHKWDNFVWTLVVGAAFVGLHFVLKGHLKVIFRQAGGYTLASWATVSLTRAALSLPWQAGTLVVGLLLVGAGVTMEKKRRKNPDGET